ncbi:HEAT repeat domain-containing protein [Verrucomicrobiales bacterium]|nr:HEAT repeat domain-containing protein [Verrucomicrobiales bacterium]
MKPTAEIIALVNETPDLDEYGKVDGAPWPESAKIYDTLLNQGADSIRQVVGMLQVIDDGTDYKPRYVIHGLVMHAGKPEKQVQRKLLRETLCSELQEDYPASIKGYLLRQLQLCGNDSSVPVIGAFLLDEENWEYAAQALQAIGGNASLGQFRATLAKAASSEKHLLTALQALGSFQDAPSAAAVRKHLSHESETIRLATAWALAMMADAEAVPGLLKLVDNTSGWARLQVVDFSLTLADKLAVAGKNALSSKIRDHLDAAQKEEEPIS